MQKLVTEVRRFRSDQGLNDRRKVPARLSDIAEADLDSQVPAVTSLAWLTPAGTDSARQLRCRCGCRAARSWSNWTRRAASTSLPNGAAWKGSGRRGEELAGTTGKLGNDAFLAKAPDEVVDKIRARQQLAREEVDRISGTVGKPAMTE